MKGLSSKRGHVVEDPNECYGIKRHRWRTLKGFWRYHRRLPGSIKNFVAFCEAPSAKWLEEASWAELMMLPGVTKRHLISLGGSFTFTKGYVHKWRVVEAGEAWTTKDGFAGMGRTADHAALSGLVYWWELITYRMNAEKEDKRRQARKAKRKVRLAEEKP